MLSTVLVYPAVSTAAHFRQYSASLCVPYASQASSLSLAQGQLTNVAVSPTLDPDANRARFECPLVEDESNHSKGSATLSLTFDQQSNNWGSIFMPCVTFDNATGGTCGQQISVSSTPPGIKNVSTSPPASIWSTGLHYGYVYVALGAKTSSSNVPNTFKGYWLTTP